MPLLLCMLPAQLKPSAKVCFLALRAVHRADLLMRRSAGGRDKPGHDGAGSTTQSVKTVSGRQRLFEKQNSWYMSSFAMSCSARAPRVSGAVVDGKENRRLGNRA
jgi:hypothetical protein